MFETNLETSPTAKAPVISQTQGMPSVLDFQDFRKYLAAWLERRKQIQPEYSGALFARRAGLQSHTLLGMVIRNQRNLSYSTMRAFARALGLKAKELRYFESLVLFNQSKTTEDKTYHLEQMRQAAMASGISGAGAALVTKVADYADYLSNWHVVAIREMINLPVFQPEPEWIARKLKSKITPKQATEALKTLLRLRMIDEDPTTKRLRVISPALDIEPGMVDFAIRNYHKGYLERARDAIEGEPLDQRELSSLTLTVNPEELERLKERIREFRKQLNVEFSGAHGDSKHVVALNMQALTLTQTETEKEKVKQEKRK